MPAKKKPGDSFRLPHRRHEYFNFFVPQPLGVVPMCESGRNILAKHKKKDNKSLTSIDEGLLKIKFECSNYNIDNLSFFISLLNHFNIINIDEAKYLVDIVTNSDRESHEEDPDFSKLLDTATSCLKDLDLNAFIHGTYENILHEDSIENAYLYARALFNYDAMVDYRKNN